MRLRVFRFRARTFALGALLLLSGVALACGAGAPAEPTPVPEVQATAVPVAEATPSEAVTTSTEAEPRYGGTLNNAHRRWPPGFDSHQWGTADTNNLTQPVFNTLLRGVHPRYIELEGEMAKSWEVEPNAKEVTFTLWPGIKTHSGHDYTAEHVKWTLERLRDDDTLDEHGRVGAEIDRVEVIDPETLKVFLHEPSAAWVPKLSSARVAMYHPQEFIDHDPTGTSDMAGTGPYRLTEVVANEVVRYERFDEYFEEGKPYFDGLNIHIIREPATRLAALEAGDLDILNVGNATGITPDMWQTAADRSNGQIIWHRGVHLSGRAVQFNSAREGPWQDKRVRQAINLAISRENAGTIPVAVGPGGYYPPTGNWNIPLEEMWDNMPGWATGDNKQQEIEEAKALLAEAGYGPGDLTIDVVTRDIADYALYHGPLMVEEMRSIGIEANLRIEESARYLERFQARDFDVILSSVAGVAIDDPDLSTAEFMCGSPRNRNEYCNPEFDELAREQRVVTDLEERRRIVRQMEEILWEDLWTIPVWWAGRHPGHRDWVVNPPILSSSGQHVSGPSRFLHSWFTEERIQMGP